MPKPKDFSPRPFPSLSWDSGEIMTSLEKLHEYSVEEVKRFSHWYYEKRKMKKHLGYWLRFFAILITAAAGVIPILSEIFEKNGEILIKPSWATLALAIAALLVLLDKFGGYTSGWVRYIMAGQELSQLLETFRFQWENTKITLLGQESLAADQVAAAVNLCKTFLEQAHQVIRQETRLWVTEFQSTLKDLEKTAKAVTRVEEAGAISVEISNGDLCENGWKLKIDEGSERLYQGKQASIHNISPKIHTLSVIGTIDQKQKRAEKPVAVLSGKITTVTLTLE